jgi:hypothetical protein
MAMNKKTALWIGGGIVVLGVGFFIYKKWKAKRMRNKYGMPNLNNSPSSSSSSSSSGSSSSSSSSFDPSPYTRQIHQSMSGLGTDENLFFNTARALNSEQRAKVKTDFDTKHGSLKEWIKGDFRGSDETDALNLFNL